MTVLVAHRHLHTSHLDGHGVAAPLGAAGGAGRGRLGPGGAVRLLDGLDPPVAGGAAHAVALRDGVRRPVVVAGRGRGGDQGEQGEQGEDAGHGDSLGANRASEEHSALSRFTNGST